ncbi:type I-U CRISPR-associated protein Csx17 [Nocardia sp. BMG51109]|uniref:type I-G CRISPR-associated protein Cas8g1/Csx17 n=1 Tax=Nocardia sp. BMG51109 TaxID=1056816 RepID=UPI0004634B3F|nr:type I-U CRISPR-associated protein Csx17 [Nocardia sp. BMG51109]
MTDLNLTGCRTTPLSGYLSALGVHRAMHRLLDPSATGYWKADAYRLHSTHTAIDELAADLHPTFRPESIVSPWNSGSGFVGNGKSASAERILQWVRDSTDDRMEDLRQTVAAADRVLTLAHRRGIDDPWDKKRKPEVLRLCRNELPDAAVSWMDAAVALTTDDLSYSRLLGTGGNLGRQDLSATYLQQVRLVLEHRHSQAWLASALDGRPRMPLPKDTPGQYDPGGVGAPEEPNPVGNPWTFLFVLEGALLFATAVVRRHGADYARAALPFQVAATTAGFASTASGERPLAELWAPEWSQPMQIPEIKHLFGEGRADWNSSAARSGLDMARAAATLGVDRGITAFERHVFVDRLGQNPIAVPAGRIDVGIRGGTDLLAPLDRWRDRLRQADPPTMVTARLRALDQALYDQANLGTARALIDVFAALGRCRSAVERSGAVRDVGRPNLPAGERLFPLLLPELGSDRDLRIALALATSRDHRNAFADWLVASSATDRLPQCLAEIARRRGFPGATAETANSMPAVRGVRIAFERGMRLRSGDIRAFVAGAVDDSRIMAVLLGLSCVNWRDTPDATLTGDRAHDPALNLLLPFSGAKPFPYTTIDGVGKTLLVRPGHDWVAQLTAGHTDRVLRDASRRLRIARLRQVVTLPSTELDGSRLAAALLFTSPPADRRAGLARVAVIGTPHPLSPTKEPA